MPPRLPIARIRRRFAATATSTAASPLTPMAPAPSSEASLSPPKAGVLPGSRKPERPDEERRLAQRDEGTSGLRPARVGFAIRLIAVERQDVVYRPSRGFVEFPL